MSPEARYNTKWVLTITSVTIGILIAVITATAQVTTRFNQNDSDHIAITTALNGEIKSNAEETLRSRQTDEKMAEMMRLFDHNLTIMQQDINHLVDTTEEIKKGMDKRAGS